MRGVIAHYRMDDNAASATVIDQTGNHNGTYKDASGNINTSTGATTGKMAGGLGFDGTGKYVEIADHADFTPVLTPFSISACINVHDTVDFGIAVKGIQGIDAEWAFALGNDEKLTWYLYNQTDIAAILVKYDTALTAYIDEWLHVAATYDGGTSVSSLGIHLNGEQVNDATVTLGSFTGVVAYGYNPRVGFVGPTDYADGLIDNVIFYNRVLSVQESHRQYHLYKTSRGRSRDRFRSTERNW